MKYEIEIEGVPGGWEPVKYAHHTPADHFVNDAGEVVRMPNMLQGPKVLIVRRKVRKYDWTQVLPSVLVTVGGKALYRSVDVDTPYPKDMRLSDEWQPNIHGKCPVDPGACIVRIKCSYGHIQEKLASEINWDTHLRQFVVAWQFIRLVDGVEW